MKNSTSMGRNFNSLGLLGTAKRSGAFLPLGLILLAACSASAQSGSPGVIVSPSWSTNPSGNANTATDNQPAMIADPKPSAAILPPAGEGTPNPAYGWPTSANGSALPGDPNSAAGYAPAPATPHLQPRPVMPSEDTIDGEIVTSVPSPENELPEGTLIRTRLQQEIRSDPEFAGTPFTAYLTEGIMKNGRIIIPAGSTVRGRIIRASSASLVHGGANIFLRPDEIITPNGTQLMLHAMVVKTDDLSDTKTKGEGMIVDSPDKAKTAGTIALTTGVGAGAGAIFGGPIGALTGASIGASVGTVHWLAHTRTAFLPKDSRVVFSLSEPMSLDAFGPRSTAGLENEAPIAAPAPTPQPMEAPIQPQVATTPY